MFNFLTAHNIGPCQYISIYRNDQQQSFYTIDGGDEIFISSLPEATDEQNAQALLLGLVDAFTEHEWYNNPVTNAMFAGYWPTPKAFVPMTQETWGYV